MSFAVSETPAGTSPVHLTQTDWTLLRVKCMPAAPLEGALRATEWVPRHGHRRRTAMTRATGNITIRHAVRGRDPSAPALAFDRHPATGSDAPPGHAPARRCNWITWPRKCLSMPPTRKRPALWWLTETRSRSSTLNPRTNASLLAI